MSDGPAAELQDDVLAQIMQKLVHLAGMYAAGGHRHHPGQTGPVLLEENTALQIDAVVAFAQHVVEALHRVGIAFELAHDRAGVDVIDTRQSHPLADHAEGDAMIPLTRVGRMTGPVQVQQHIVAPRPACHRLDRRVADHQIDHDDHRAELAGEIGPLVHLLHRPGGDVQVMPLDLARSRLRPVHRLHAVEEAIAPVHERLRVDVLIVLGEIQAALERLVHDPSVVAP